VSIRPSLIPSHEAESASALLFRTLGAHRTAITTLQAERPTRLRAATDGDPLQDRRQATLVRLLSITESFAADLLSREIDKAANQASHPSISKIADDAVNQAIGTWAGQKKSYKEWLGISESWTKVEQLTEARNAVAHGLGKLTRRQLRNESGTTSQLRAVGIAVNNQAILLTEENLQSAALICRDFIERIDLAVQRRHS
jgi:hypothetical protein